MNAMSEQAMVDCLAILFENEVAAVKAYDVAIDKFTGEDEDSSLRDMRESHVSACEDIQLKLNGQNTPKKDAVAREAGWEKFVTGAAALANEKEILKALKEGEEDAISIYQAAAFLEYDDDSFCAQVENEFLPAHRRHIERINTMIEMQN